MAIANLDRLIVRDPDDGAIVGELAITPSSQIEQALETASEAGRRTPPPAHARARILETVAGTVEAEAEIYARLIATEGIKTIREARMEVRRCVVTLRLGAEEARRIGGGVVPFDQAPAGEDRQGWYQLVPAGPVLAITPFNDPLNLVAHKLAPAMALGAPVILKPHPQTPFSALRLHRAFLDAGAEPQRMQIVIGHGDAGAAMVKDGRIRVVSFTGGRQAGAAVAATAGLKRLLMELGGVGVVAVDEGVDLDAVADAIDSGAFFAAGQNCVHAQRIIAHRAVATGLRDRLVERAAKRCTGPKLDPATDVGPIVDDSAADHVMAMIAAARDGGTVLTGGTRSGRHIAPTWIELDAPTHFLASAEIFGPVATLETADGRDDLLDRIAAAPDAINVAIFTPSLNTALAVRERARAAAVIVNDSTDFRIDAMPFGGTGGAGLGREGVADAIEAMAEKRLFVLRRSA
ncbi:aldehyde dehydrogenase family protein [Sphingomonas sp. AP4-R1]|uniref:aldehyde dehydrogenase family protein n=1 Tax=Sphingomonas sp. AP4-R1 TaxID=2735134 RepID=UPI0014938002|nr:aldehyde dehydrogenase family protein [Sphingomonas sp. AP4-R1]QJU56953.1 aldehyde dehydrogenase family protein [Sphingomonas sp. AP4-R1]